MRYLVALFLAVLMTGCGGGSPFDIIPDNHQRAGIYDMGNGDGRGQWEITADLHLITPHVDHPALMVDRGAMNFNGNAFTLDWITSDDHSTFLVIGAVTATGMTAYAEDEPEEVITGVRLN